MSLYGANKQRGIASDNRRYQEQQRDLAYKRSMPWSSQGPAGSVNFDPESQKMIQSLSPEYQAMMDGWMKTSGMANTALQGMMSDPYAMEQEQFKRFEEMNADAYSQSRMQGQESALASGRMGGTQGYYDKLATEGAISKDRLGGQMQAMNTGMAYRQMLGQESQGFGAAAQNVAGMLNPQADLGRMIGQGLNTNANSAGVSRSGDNYADTRAAGLSGQLDQLGKYDFKGGFQDLKGMFGFGAKQSQMGTYGNRYDSMFMNSMDGY